MIFYLSIVLYISSVIGALVMMIAGRNLNQRKLLLPAAVHGILFMLYLFNRFIRSEGSGDSIDFIFLLFICSGVSLCGIVWRTKVAVPLRLYFSLFALTFPMFLFSPSRLVNFLLTSHYTDTLGKSFPIEGNVFMEQQNSWSGTGTKNMYKIIRKKGIFHQNIARDIRFDQPVDSIRILVYREGDTAVLRGYHLSESFVDVRIDSQDVHVSLKMRKRNTIERRLQP